ncbi:MAG: hypothetical protein QOK04_1113, partial [Solirubrobacteraceae bacterium]|nr:hypothetical protein [Solirubrobacteraceae bacterium]
MSNPVGSARRNSSLAALIANTLLSAVSGITALRTHIESSFVRGLAGLPDRVLRALVREPVAIDGQHLHVEVQLILKLLALAGEPLIET